MDDALAAIGLSQTQPRPVFVDRTGKQHSSARDADLANIQSALEREMRPTAETGKGRMPRLQLPPGAGRFATEDMARWVLDNALILRPYIEAQVALKPKPDPRHECP